MQQMSFLIHRVGGYYISKEGQEMELVHTY
jgi:hypothetical protein